MHLLYYPVFIKQGYQPATIVDVMKHIEHLCGLGGVTQIGFGSDFDGIDQHVGQLEHAGQYEHLINELLKHYSESEVRGFASETGRARLNSSHVSISYA